MDTRELCAFIVETKGEKIPRETRVQAQAAVIDTLGVALGGSIGEAARIARRYADSIGARPATLVWGTPQRTAAAEAAFINAISGHVLDFDDTLPSLTGHPSVPLCAAGLAASSGRVVTGQEFLSAFVLAIEVAGTFGHALKHGHYAEGWHPTATVGAFSSAAMAGRILGLTVEQMQCVFGLAAAQSAGMVRNFGTMAKPFQAGHAARSGYMAAWLAGQGMTASGDILEGRRGYIAAYGGEDASLDVPALGEPWEILSPGIYVKRWPCCYGVHRAVAGIFEMIADHAIVPEDVERVEVGFLPDADRALIHTDPQSGLEGKFSIEYCAAAALLDRKITLASFRDEAVQRPEIRALMQKVHRFPMPGEGSFSGVHGYTDVIIQTTRGRFERRVEHTPGSPQAPMTMEDRREKFMSCSDPILGEERSARLLETLESFEELEDVARLDPLLIAE